MFVENMLRAVRTPAGCNVLLCKFYEGERLTLHPAGVQPREGSSLLTLHLSGVPGPCVTETRDWSTREKRTRAKTGINMSTT